MKKLLLVIILSMNAKIITKDLRVANESDSEEITVTVRGSTVYERDIIGPITIKKGKPAIIKHNFDGFTIAAEFKNPPSGPCQYQGALAFLGGYTSLRVISKKIDHPIYCIYRLEIITLLE